MLEFIVILILIITSPIWIAIIAAGLCFFTLTLYHRYDMYGAYNYIKKMKTYTYYIEFKKRCAETVTIEAPSEEEARKSLNETFRNLTLVELISEE